MSEWGDKATERLKKFASIVKKSGYYLGFWTDRSGQNHLVITLNEPYGQSQWAAFVFPWVDTRMGEGFLAPFSMEKIEAFPLKDNWEIAISVTNCLQMFKKAKRKLSGATKFFVINLDTDKPFKEVIGFLKRKKLHLCEIDRIRVEYCPGVKVVITKANPPGPDVARLNIICRSGRVNLDDWKRIHQLIYREVIEKVALPNLGGS